MGNTARLRVGIVGHWNWILIHASVLAVFHDSHNCGSELLAELMADWVGARHQPFGECLIDDHHGWGGFGIRVGDVAAIQNRHTHYVEEVGADFIRAQGSLGVRALHTVDRGCIVVAPSRAWAILRKRDGLNSWQAS